MIRTTAPQFDANNGHSHLDVGGLPVGWPGVRQQASCCKWNDWRSPGRAVSEKGVKSLLVWATDPAHCCPPT
eukprot:scaffold3418_cov124-Isochrysis_galbana.AAC.1